MSKNHTCLVVATLVTIVSLSLQYVFKCDFLIPNFTKLFQSSMWVEIDVRHMKEAPSTLLRYISEKGQYASKCVLLKFKLELALHYKTCVVF